MILQTMIRTGSIYNLEILLVDSQKQLTNALSSSSFYSEFSLVEILSPTSESISQSSLDRFLSENIFDNPSTHVHRVSCQENDSILLKIFRQSFGYSTQLGVVLAHIDQLKSGADYTISGLSNAGVLISFTKFKEELKRSYSEEVLEQLILRSQNSSITEQLINFMIGPNNNNYSTNNKSTIKINNNNNNEQNLKSQSTKNITLSSKGNTSSSSTSSTTATSSSSSSTPRSILNGSISPRPFIRGSSSIGSIISSGSIGRTGGNKISSKRTINSNTNSNNDKLTQIIRTGSSDQISQLSIPTPTSSTDPTTTTTTNSTSSNSSSRFPNSNHQQNKKKYKSKTKFFVDFVVVVVFFF